MNSCRISDYFDTKFTPLVLIEPILQTFEDLKITNFLNPEQVYFLLTLITWVLHIYLSEESAYSLLSHEKDGVETQGLSVLMKAYEQHKDNAEVVESICSLIMELAEYGECGKEWRERGSTWDQQWD